MRTSLYAKQRTYRLRTRVYLRLRYVTQGVKVHKFIAVGDKFTEIGVYDISDVYTGVPDDIDAAFTWGSDQHIYFIKGTSISTIYIYCRAECR